MTYAPARIHEEVAYVAYHFHWALDEILDLEHAQRLRYVAEIADINKRLDDIKVKIWWGFSAAFMALLGIVVAGLKGVLFGVFFGYFADVYRRDHNVFQHGFVGE